MEGAGLRGRQVFLAWLLVASCAGGCGPHSESSARTQSAAWHEVHPAVLATRLSEVLEPRAVSADYWRDKPSMEKPFFYPAHPVASKRDREIADRLKAGEFCPYHAFDWLPIGVPPPWDANPLGNTTWDFYRHALRWTEPLVRTWRGDGDTASGQLLERTLRDWIQKNSRPPNAPEYAWRDHAVAGRLRLLCWFWELWRTSNSYDAELTRLLLASIYQHALCAADPEMYRANSNHGLDLTGSLLAAAVTLPEFKAAQSWKDLGRRRLSQYVADNFSPEGFHLEQSPSYHWYVLDRLDKISAFLRENGESCPAQVTATLERAAAVWPLLVKPNGSMPNVGDSSPAVSRHALRFGGASNGVALRPSRPNPRRDASFFLISFDAGYAVFIAYPPGTKNPAPDTYALFKCNSFRSTHCHHDALSFVLFGLGRDWLIDSGKLNYEERTPARQYMRSARAHNVLLIDGEDFDFRSVRLVDYGRNKEGDFVRVRHELPQATHTRTFMFKPPRTIEITDELATSDGRPHVYAQLFHVAPPLTVPRPEGRNVEIVAEDGDCCRIEQSGTAGEWTTVTGQTEPTYQGWYSPSYNELRESTVLFYSVPEPLVRCTFRTRITLVDAQAESPTD